MNRILGLSLLANALLLMLLGARLSRNPHPVRTEATAGLPTVRSQPASPEVTVAFQGQAQAQPGWSWIESDDPLQLVANLRRVGCPEQTIQELVCIRLCRATRQKLLAHTAEQQRAVPYWKTAPQQQFQEQRILRQRLNDELDATLENLFGASGRALRVRAAGLPSSYAGSDYLPLNRAAQVRDVERRYRERTASEITDGNLPLGFADMDAEVRRKEISREKLAEMRQLLSPEEYELYLVHDSSAAQYVRNNLPQARSEDEFRRMVKVALEQEMDGFVSSGNRYGLPDTEADQAQKEKEKTFQLRLKQELGDDRVAAQEQAEAAREREEREQTSRRQSIAQITEIGASEEEAARLLDRLKELQPKLDARAKELMPDNATPEQRRAFEAVLKTELEQAAKDIIGPEKTKALIEKVEREMKH
jgi:hypothetical protein